MKNNADNCPCCGRHCPKDKLKCKHGRMYFTGLEKKASMPCPEAPACKWDRYTRRDGLAWHLLWAAKCTKKALRKSGCTEEEIFDVLSMDERMMLSGLLCKVSGNFPCSE